MARYTYLVRVKPEARLCWSEVKVLVAKVIRTEHSDATITGLEDDNKFFQVTVSVPEPQFREEMQKLPQVASISIINTAAS